MKKKTFRRCIGAILIITALVVASLPTGASVAETISSDFQLNGTTLVKYAGTDKTVSIPDVVEVIGEEAFLNNSTIEEVKLPANLEKISYAAFSGCNNLKKVSVPSDCTEIETAAFCNCESLSEAKIGSGLMKLGAGVFTGCPKLKDVTIESSRFKCEDGVIYDADKTKIYQVLQGRKGKTYDMPSSVTQIVPYSFYGCKKIEQIGISSNLQEIPAYAFSNCQGLKSCIIPYSVNNIDMKAFENCANLCYVEMPESVSYIHETAFDGCSKLDIQADPYTYAYKWFQNLDKSQVKIIDDEDSEPSDSSNKNDSNTNESEDEEDDEDIDEDDEEDNEEKQQKPSKYEQIPIYDVSGNIIRYIDQNPRDDSNLIYGEPYVNEGNLIGETVIVGRKAVFMIDNSKITTHNAQNASNQNNVDETNNSQPQANPETDGIISDMSEAMSSETNGKGLNLPKFAIIDDTIASKAFYGDFTLKNYEILPEITHIGDFAFARSGLESVSIPEGVTSIGYGAFYHCDNLIEVTIPSTVETIEPYAFEKTALMENFIKYSNDEYLIMGDGILVAYNGSSSVINIPENVKTIGPQAFMNHKGITQVNLPESVKTICEDAFSGCSNLKKITGGTGLVNIKDRAFSGCPLETIRIPDTVETIGLKAFNYQDTVAADEAKVCVFFGNNIPKLTVEKTSTRLSNDDYRKVALNDVKVCIVNNGVDLQGSILDASQDGFSGLICEITEENTDYFNGKLNIVGCTLSKEEASDFSIGNTIYVFGKGYNFDSSQLNEVLNKAQNKDYDSKSEAANEGQIVEISGIDETFRMEIIKDESIDNEVREAYERIYGDTVPANFTTYDITLRENSNNVQLTKLGKQNIEVKMELPSNVPTANLHVICTDENKQLEDLPYEVLMDEDKLKVCFNINHTGNYGLYAFNSSSASNFELDDTPDTGDGIHPKWFLSLGLLLSGIALLLIRNKKNV